MSGTEVIKVLIADDHRLFMDGVGLLLNSRENMEVVAFASNGKEALEKLAHTGVDIALLNICMPEPGGIELTRMITAKYPEVKVIALSLHDQVSYIVNVLHAGAKGYLLKQISKPDMLKAIETVYSGGVYYSPEIAVALANRMFKEGMSGLMPQGELSQRELGIIRLVAKGEANKKIADQLFISEATVKTHRQRIQTKLQVKNTAGLIRYAYDHHLIDPL